MAWTRRMTMGLYAAGAGTGLVIALAAVPAIGGSTPAAAAPGGCSATAHVDSQWATGQIVTVTLTNTGSTAGTRWTATWTLASGQSVVSAWSATLTTSGSSVTAVNMPYNGSLAPGASTSFGMQLNGAAPAPVVSCDNDASVVSPSASQSSQSSGADVTLTEADNGTTITLAVPSRIRISLGMNFQPTSVSGPALVLLSTSGGFPTGQPLVELYRTGDVGSVDISTITDFACLHTVPRCALPQELWRVHVNVVGIGGDPPPVVDLTSPNGTSIYGEPGTIQLAATASDPGGVITKVEFSTAPFGGSPSTLVATVTTAPYTFTLVVPAANVFVIEAKAYDDGGLTATDTVQIHVAVSDPPPSRSPSPN